MKKRLALLVAAVAAFGVIGVAPASAATCANVGVGDVNAQEACALAARVICGVVAKGEPCLN